jgi:ATP-dependent metalloprotease FtsH
LVVILAVFFFLKKNGQKQFGSIFELRKTRARQLDSDNKTSFADVGGLDNAIESLTDLVVYLRNPTVWTATGTRAPRGVLLTGPPGTGKTLLARALAGETDSAFFYTSATEFVEMFVGVGAARVRDTFEKAAKEKAAVIFIDELDAIGRQRSSGVGVMHKEREQTLNQLLVLMDGLERHEHVIVLAATNRADVLDSALTRPGRFDRTLHVNAPDAEGRKQILKIHCRDKPLADDVDLAALAENTGSFTGADLETLLNEASIIAMRRNAQTPGARVQIGLEDIKQSQREMQTSQTKFDRLDAVLVESVSQLAEPTGRAVARITMVGGQVLEGDVVWMNSTHMKLRSEDGKETIVSRDHAAIIEALEGTEKVTDNDIAPDRWAKSQIDVR